MRLAIVGSTDLVDDPEASNIILELFREFWPDTIVSGGADGIDKLAAKLAREQNIEVKEHLPRGTSWYYYKERNIFIAQDCDFLVRITHPLARTYGSGWTRDYAASLGIPTREYMVRQ